jgi:hypothetical protein
MLECLCDPCHVKAHEDREALDIAVSMRSTRELPAMLRIINRVNGVMAADSQRSRADAINRLLDELDCVADDQRAFEAMP